MCVSKSYYRNSSKHCLPIVHLATHMFRDSENTNQAQCITSSSVESLKELFVGEPWGVSKT